MAGMLAMATGICLAAFVPRLPAPELVAGLVLLGIALVAIPLGRVVGWLLLGLSWGWAFGHTGLAGRLPGEWEGQLVRLEGVVGGLPRTGARVQRFDFSVTGVTACPAPRPCELLAGSRVLLSSYGLRVDPGERWQLSARLRRPRGSANPGTLDYEAWLLSKRIAATGYVVESRHNRRLAPDVRLGMLDGTRRSVDAWRHRAREAIVGALEFSPYRELVVALAVGESRAIRPEQWRVLSLTGTNHLMIISGLHVGLVAGLAVRLVSALGAGSVWVAATGIGCGLLYALFAGFGLPAQRATIMVTAVLLARVGRRHAGAPGVFALALLLVVAANPLAVWNTGFWLSFGAVFFLLYGLLPRQLGPEPSRVVRGIGLVVRSQLLVFIGLFPLLGYLVLQNSLVAPLVNLLAIPWVSLVVVPATVVTTAAALCFPSHGQLLFTALEVPVGMLWFWLERAASWELVWYPPRRAAWLVLVWFLGALLLAAPRGLPLRWLGIFMLVPLMTAERRGMEAGAFEATILDAGQGLAVAVVTGHGVLVYDVGGRYSESFDIGGSVLAPYLRSLGIDRVDRVIVSHGEMDHSGGLSGLLEALPVDSIVSGSAARVADQLGHRRFVAPCRRGDAWSWGHVQFSILYPPDVLSPEPGSGETPRIYDPHNENERSCVVHVSSPAGSLLLPGDLEQGGEAVLRRLGMPSADVLVVPHHGSRTSSSPGFINAVRPRLAVVSAAYRSRFNHPAKAVLTRYSVRGVRVLETAFGGAVTIRFTPGQEPAVEEFRRAARRYWYPD